MKALATEHGGRCLSRRYVNKRTPMEWECGEGHRWEATPANVLRGHWCHTCGKGARRLTNIGELKALAEERGGRCLSQEYVNVETPVQWKCGKGHGFELRVAQVKDGGKWCSVCEKTRALDAMKALAADRGKVFVAGIRGREYAPPVGMLSVSNRCFAQALVPPFQILPPPLELLAPLFQVPEQSGLVLPDLLEPLGRFEEGSPSFSRLSIQEAAYVGAVVVNEASAKLEDVHASPIKGSLVWRGLSPDGEP